MIESINPINGRTVFANLIGCIVGFVGRIVANAVSTVQSRKLIFTVIVFSFLATSLMGKAQGNLDNQFCQEVGAGPDCMSANSVEPNAPPAPTKLGFDALDVFRMIAEGIDTKLNSLSDSTALLGARDIILGVGLAIGLFWTGLKTMVAGKGIGELLGEWIPILITAGVVTAFTVPGPGSAGEQISKTLDKIAGAITKAAGGTSVDTSSVKNVTESAVATTFNTITSIAEIPRNNEASGLNIAGMLKNVPIAIFAGLMKIIASLIIVVAMCIYLATAVMAMMSIKLVIALAPVMVPFLIFKPTAWLFDSWLRYLLGAGMLKLVGAFMLSMTGGLMDSINIIAHRVQQEAAAGTVDSYSGDIVLFSSLFLVAILCSLLMAQVPSIASGLLAGSAGGAGFSSMRGVTQTIGARAGQGAAGAAGSAAAHGGRWAYDKAYGEKRAARKGAEHAVEGFSNSGKHFGSQRTQNAYIRANAQEREVQTALRNMERRDQR